MSDTFLDDFTERLRATVETQIQERVEATMTGRQAARYLSGLTVEATSDEITVKVKGAVPNFLELGLGPGGVGTEGPFDMRAQRMAKGYRRVMVAPGIVRTLSVHGKPWIHPGFVARHLLRGVQADLSKLAAKSRGAG